MTVTSDLPFGEQIYSSPFGNPFGAVESIKSYLLQEDGFKLLQEDGFGIVLN